MAQRPRGDGLTPSTRERLLDAAERVFAEKGYHATTVRDITEAAGVNVAAVHYHFGGKKELYLELFRKRFDHMAAVRESALALAAGRDPAEDLAAVVRGFVRGWLARCMDEDRAGASRFHLMLMREIGDPGPAYHLLLDRVIRPTHELFRDLIRGVRPDMDEARATLCAGSLIGQILHFVRARRVLEDLLGRPYDRDLVEAIVEHVVCFTLRGIGAGP